MAVSRFGPGNHAKVMCVSEGDDDSTALVAIGSDNMYPSPLSEFNFVIEGTEAIRAFRRQYWDRLWGYSARWLHRRPGRQHHIPRAASAHPQPAEFPSRHHSTLRPWSASD